MTTDTSKATFPSRRPFAPRVRLRIGITGHRLAPKLPNEAVPHIRATIDRVLAAFTETAKKAAEGFSRETSELAIVSSLADGSDRIVAEAGLAIGCGLEAVLPFARAEYMRDFENTPGSAAAFEVLIGCTSSVFELDGNPDERPRAYEAAGFVMLANSDLLITIWNGDEADGVGGTAQIVGRAIAEGIPVVWINPASPDKLQLSWPRAGEMPLANALPRETFRPIEIEAINGAVRDIVLPPSQKEAAALENFLAEKERRWTFCPWYPLLLLVFGGRPMKWDDLHLGKALAGARGQWQDYFNALPTDNRQRHAIETILLPAYITADHLAIFYAQKYRSAYVSNFMFAAIAVFIALCGIFIHEPKVKSITVGCEFAIIALISITWWVGDRWQWHRRWLDYRRLAESLRQMRILTSIGSPGPVERPNSNVDEEDWVNWYAWSLRRLLPLPDRVVDTAYLDAVRTAVRSAEIAGQIRYHTANAERIEKVQRRMHAYGEHFFRLTLFACFSFLVSVSFFSYPNDKSSYLPLILGGLTFVTALLPTAGAALGAIHVQGEFKTVFEQSKQTARRLAVIDAALEYEDLVFARLCDRIEKTSEVMMADVEEWQMVFRTRPLSLPV